MNTVKFTDLDRIYKSSTKGNQPKWCMDGFWYKADSYHCYQGLSEMIVSRLLEKSNYRDFVRYDLCHLELPMRNAIGCKSRDFLKKNQSIITLQRLLFVHFGIDFASKLREMECSTKEKFDYLYGMLERIGVQGYREYFAAMFQIDSVCRNTDRHTNNIAFLVESGRIMPAPLFDFGESLYSDCEYYSFSRDSETLIQMGGSKPLSLSFEEQAEVSEELSGYRLKMNFGISDIRKIRKEALEFYDSKYVDRALSILKLQMEALPKYFGASISEI